MKKLIVLLSLLSGIQGFSQDSLHSFSYARNHITLTGMEVLGSWGLLNLGIGSVGWAGSGSGPNKYFYQMSTLWGAVNTGAAALGFMGAKRNLIKQTSKANNVREQAAIEKIFLINSGLDFVYIGAGIYTNSRGNSRDDATLKGYGSSVIMQGFFLLLFDGAMFNLQRTNGRKMSSYLKNNLMTFTGNRIGIAHLF